MQTRSILAENRFLCKLAFWAVIALQPFGILHAQDLAPRAYVITPLHSNAILLGWTFHSGTPEVNNAFPITGESGTYNVMAFSFYHSFNFFGRSANMTAWLPYGVGNFDGTLQGVPQHSYKSGLVDCGFRFAVNLKGGPTMELPKFMKWKQKVLLGASLKVVPPTGQYDPTTVVNLSINRWRFKPEFGYSQRFKRNWVLDAYAGVWFFTTNPEFFNLPAPEPQSQAPIGAFEGHISYDAKPRLWFSLDGNFWYGGTATLGGMTNPNTKQANSRIGATLSVPLDKHQSIKVSYSTGAYIRYGGDANNLSVAWQYGWLGRPK